MLLLHNIFWNRTFFEGFTWESGAESAHKHTEETKTHSLNEGLPLANGFFVGRGQILLMNGILENFCLQYWQKCGNTLWVSVVQGIVICHEVEQSLIKPLSVEGGHWHFSNGDHAVVLGNKHNWTRQWSLAQETIRILWSLDNTNQCRGLDLDITWTRTLVKSWLYFKTYSHSTPWEREDVVLSLLRTANLNAPQLVQMKLVLQQVHYGEHSPWDLLKW